MKRIWNITLVFVLTLCLLTGCRPGGGNDHSYPGDSSSEPVSTGSEDGGATDDNGILGEDNRPENSRRSGRIFH